MSISSDLCEKSGETNFDPLCIRIAGMTAKVVAYCIYMKLLIEQSGTIFV